MLTLLAAACATKGPGAPIEYRTIVPTGAPRMPSGQRYLGVGGYAQAPAFIASPELSLCSDAVSNPGATDGNGRVATYTPYITVRNITLARGPTQGGCLSSGFGWRDLNANGGRPHNGVDYARPMGPMIYAAAAGRVVSAGRLGEFGNAIEIDHGSGVHTLYAHLSDIAPSIVEGAIVPAGAAIGQMGDTGNATGVHLHFQIMIDELEIDPLGPGDGTRNPEPLVGVSVSPAA